MNKYKDAKVYKLTSKQTTKIYVGSTIQTLVARLTRHKTHYKCGNYGHISSCEILKYDDCIIELIEDYPCDSKKELEKREQHYMDLYRDIIVNIQNTTKFCEHNKLQYDCIECKGLGICEHLKRRRYCKICNNVKICIGITNRNKLPCTYRANPDSDYCGRHTPK